jgi:hypothetical protein
MATKKAPLEIYFDARKGTYWVRFPGAGRFLNLDARNVKLHLMREGARIDSEDEWGLKTGDRILTNAQIDRCCDYAGPLAGHEVGLRIVQGKRVLVTSEAQPVEAKRGPYDRLEGYLEQLLPGDQLRFLLYWLKIARESLLNGDFRPGQMLVLAGPSGCGKSLLQALITEFLGGRMAKPYRYMSGATQFNSDLAGAEHLVIADETASVDIRSRREIGSKVKDLCVNLEMSLHAKGCEALTVQTFRRLSLSCNDEAENLMILPPLDESILDKILLFKCAIAKIGANRKKIWQQLTSELPGLAYVLEKLAVPPALRCDRYGFTGFHNPELLEQITGLSPENRLEALIDEVIPWAKIEGAWEGTSIELERELRNSAFSFAVEKLLSFSSACGVYLQRLSLRDAARFSHVKRKGKTIWTIGKAS